MRQLAQYPAYLAANTLERGAGLAILRLCRGPDQFILVNASTSVVKASGWMGEPGGMSGFRYRAKSARVQVPSSSGNE